MCEWKQFYSFLSSIDAFFVCLFLYFFEQISISNTMLNKGGMRRHPPFVPNLRGNTFSPFNSDVSCRFFIYFLYQIDIFSLFWDILSLVLIHFNFILISLRILCLCLLFPFNQYLCLYLKCIFAKQNIIGSEILCNLITSTFNYGWVE